MLVAVTILWFCSGIAASVATPRFAFVADQGDNTVSEFTINADTGQLRANGWISSGGTKPAGLTVTPGGKFLYVANSGSATVSAFAVNTRNGQFSQVVGSPFAVGTTPSATATDPSGKFLYVANTASGSVSAFTVNTTTGALTAVTGSPFTAGTSPEALAVDSSGKFLLTANNGSNNISVYSINGSSGALTQVSGSPFAAGTAPAAIVVTPADEFVYVANNGSNNVSGYLLNTTTGALTAVAGSPFSAGMKPSAVAVDPSTKFAYVANSGSNNVSEYLINSTTGALTPVSGSPVGAGTAPASLTVDPSGKFVFVGNKNSSDISAFGLNSSTGALTALVPGPQRARKSPVALVVSSGSTAIVYTPTFVYVANFGIGTTAVPAFSVDPNTGALTAIAGSPFGSGSPQSLASTPNGKFVYTANDDGSSTVGEYKVNPTTGALTSVGTILGGPGQPFVAVDPSNRFVYQVGGNTDGVYAYNIIPATGALTAISGSPFTSEISAPFGLAVDPTGRFLLVVDSVSCPTCTPAGITVFTINTNSGALTLVAGSPFPPPAGVFSLAGITVDPTGRFAYLVNNEGTCCVSSYRINPNTGALTLVGKTLPAGSNPEHITTDIAGQYVYTSGNDTDVFGYTIDNKTGALTAMAHSPFNCPGCATQGLRADPSGNYLYVADRFHITGYSIDATTGALTELSTSPYPTGPGSDPFDVTVTGTIK
jgi:6-phosphogluconolactonase (cycloisomerase 2 family)